MTYFDYLGRPMPESAAEQARVVGTSAGGETINAPAGNSSLSGEGGGDVLVGNTLDNRHWITDPKDIVVEQANGGIDTEIGWTSIKLAANVENLQVNGGFNYAVGNELSNLIVVDNTSHWVYGAGGDDVLVGAATDKTSFIVKAGEGSDVIYNWNGNDQLQLLGYGFKTGADIRGAMTQQGDDVVLKLSATETLTFRGATPAAFADRQFLLPLDTAKLGAMTFSDEFNSLSVWDPNTGAGLWKTNFGGNLKDPWAFTLPSNGERQVYIGPGFYGQGEQDLGINPLSVSNGALNITAQRLPDELRDAAWGREYSSGMINTLGTFEQQYGYFEMRAELPQAAGTWPAFWLMPTPYTASTEADIMEGLAATPNVDYRRAWGGGENLYDNAYKIDPTGFHTYGMLWTQQTVTFYYDGVAVLQAATPANWTQPMGLIVNMAVGGWGGEPNSLAFPDQMKVDYIHVYNLADNSAVIETGSPELPVATLRPDGAATSGQAAASLTFDQDGTALSSAHVAVYGAKPTTLPPGKTFVVWEDSGAVFGAVSDGTTLGKPTALMAGHSSVFTGAGTWLTDGKVVLGYMAGAVTGDSAWAMVYDTATNTFTKHQLGVSTGDIDFVALKNGNFAASWDAPDGTTHARAYDGFAYDGKGWFGPERVVTGDLTGMASNGDLIAQSGSGQQLYSINNPPPSVSAIVSIGPMAGVTHAEGASGLTAYTFTLTRDYDLSQKTTVGWNVRGQGANPTDAADFQGNVLPSGVATFEINQASTTVTVYVQGDSVSEADEQFLITLVNPVNAKLGQATATGFVLDDDSGQTPPPEPAAPQISFNTLSRTVAEGASGITPMTYTVVRTGDTSGTSSVNWSVAGSGSDPASASDFAGAALPSGTLTFAAGETSKTLTVNIAGDSTVEANEGFTITLSGAGGATLGTATATGSITNDDQPTTPPPSSGTGQVYTSPGPGSTVVAGSGDDTINASQGSDQLTGGAGADVFRWAKEPWSPATVTDFVVGADKLDLSALFSASGYTGSDPVADKYIILLTDSAGTKVLFDKDGAGTAQQWGNYVINLAGVTGPVTWAQLSGGETSPPPSTGPGLRFASSTVTANEGDSGSTTLVFTLLRTGSTVGAFSVDWGSEAAGTNPASESDFYIGKFPGGVLKFADGQTSATISVQIRGDTTVEPDETFRVVVRDGPGGTAGATATGTITNDDQPTTPPPSSGTGQVYTSPGPGSTVVAGSGDDTINASQGSDQLTGGAGADVFRWAREPWSPATVTDFAVGTDKLDLSALFSASGYTGSDPVADKYIILLTDSAGTKVLFDKDGAGTAQQWGNYVINLAGVTGPVTWAQLSGGGGTTPPAGGSAQVGFTTLSRTVAEGASGSAAFSYTVTRTGDTSGTASVGWSVAGSGSDPANAADFVGGALPSGTLSFAAGETAKTLTVNVAGDTTAEADEGFTITLSGPTGATLGTATATGVITNDDQATNPPPSGSGQVITSTTYGATLTGGSGDDTINAGQGPDVLTGGAGADHFAYANPPWNAGHITDFAVGTDVLDLSGLLSSAHYAGSDPIADGYVLLSGNGAGGTVVSFDSDGPGSANPWPTTVTTLDGVATTGLTWAKLSGAAATPSAAAVMVVFAGQSNAGGYGMDASTVPATWKADPLTLIWDSAAKAWTQMNPGENTGYEGQPHAWGAEVQFAIDFRAAHPDEVLRIVKDAAGGTPLAQDTAQWHYDWSPDSDNELFDRVTGLIRDASAAAGGLRPSAVFFGQGEEDGNSAAAAGAYGTNLANLFTAVRAEWMGDANGKIGFFQVANSTPYASDVRHGEAEVDAADPNALSVDTLGYAMQGDSLHYAASSHIAIGDHYFEMFQGWQGSASEPPGQVITSTGYGATLVGGAGADTINAGQGPDVLTGGGGADRFVFAAAPWNPGRITDFAPGSDKIDLRGIFDAAGYTGTDPLHDGHMTLQDTANGVQVMVDADGAGGDWPITVTTLTGVTASQLTAATWIVQ